MRVTLADPSLARYAGRFVWLSLNFDRPENQAFLTRHGVTYTPAFFILDPSDEHATATQLGGMTLIELTQFLERGEHSFVSKALPSAASALARGDELLAEGKNAEAAQAYSDALRQGGESWSEYDRAVASFTWASMLSKQSQACAQIAAAQGSRMARGESFARIVLAGLACVNQDQSASWAEPARRVLEPLALEAISLTATMRDHRFQLYQQLMYAAEARGDKTTMKQLGDRWLTEIQAIHPSNDDERTALDVARVDAALEVGEPGRVIPALIESERLMPSNYNASLRLAQMEIEARRYDEAIAACDRGLRHVTGPIGRTWLLQVEAEALLGKGEPKAAQRMLGLALTAAQEIGVKQSRDNNVARIMKAMKEVEKTAK